MSAATPPGSGAAVIRALISDFGGVLTSPLVEAFTAYAGEAGIPLEQLGRAMADLAEQQDGEHPLFALETGRMTERDFLDALERAVSRRLARPVVMSDFATRYFEHLHINQPLLDYLRDLRSRGLRLAICTNNVREWEPLWRPRLPVDELFDVVVDSGFVGVRKPDPEIYRLTLSRLGVKAPEALLLDDVEENCRAARSLGLHAVRFTSTPQAIADVERELAQLPALADS